LNNSNITVNVLHPGVINTKLLRAGWGGFGGSVNEGAKRIYYLTNSTEVENISGKYFMNDKPVKSASISYDQDIQNRLWELSLQYAMLDLKGSNLIQ
jgi:NAD(P)-dependent dehydrogenase (short-subunit alcohol dehydrogenase family)